MMMLVRLGTAVAVASAQFFCLAMPIAAEIEQDPFDRFSEIEIPRTLTLEWCLRRAREANPAIAEAAARAEAAGHRAQAAGAFEDPRLRYDASNIPTGDLDFDSTPLSGHQLGLYQKLPFPGLRSSRKEAERMGAEADQLLLDDRRLAIDGLVEMSWAELGFAQESLDITDRNIDLLRQLLATAESQYSLGNGLQQDVLRAQVELTSLLHERLRREEAVLVSEARLIALLDLPPTSRLPRTAPLDLIVEFPALLPLLIELENKNARLRSAEKEIEESQLRVRVTELEGQPDIDLGLGYRIRSDVVGDPVDGDDFISAGFTIRLPVDRSKWRARIAETKSDLRQAKAVYRDTRAKLLSETRSAHAAFVRASSEEALLETGLLPQAIQSLEASRSAYQVGRIDFLSLLDSQVRLLGAELELARAKADKRRAFTALETATGEKLR